MKKVTLRSSAWFGDFENTFELPDQMQVDFFSPRDGVKLSDASIKEKIDHPFGMSLAEMTSGRKKVVFVVDDLGRPTPAHDLIPSCLKTLFENGIVKENIEFVLAVGSHRRMNDDDMRKKLGKDVFDQFKVSCHDAFHGPMHHLGALDNGMPCIVNQTVANADLIIGMGCIIPHPCHGFGGGAKLMCPGIAGMETIAFMHGFIPKRGRANLAPREVWDMRLASDAFTAKLPPIFLINVIVNSKREICDLFAGDYIRVFDEGSKKAHDVYKTEIDREKAKTYDVVLTNMYPLDSDPVQSGKSPWIESAFTKAISIQINQSADGVDYHGWKLLRKNSLFNLIVLSIGEGLTFRIVPQWIKRIVRNNFFSSLNVTILKYILLRSTADFDSFKKKYSVDTARPNESLPEPKIDQKPWIVSSNYASDQFKSKYPKGALIREWQTAVDVISREFPNAKVAVIPNAPMQIPAFKEES